MSQGVVGLGKLPIWVVIDGACAKTAVPKRTLAKGMTISSRLRKDALVR